MRDAERMLETAIASLEGQVSEAEVASILGVASRSRVIEMASAVIAKDAARALMIVRELHNRGANLESLGRDLLEVLRNLAVAKLPGADTPQSPLADLPDQEATELKQLAGSASLRDLMRLFHLLAEAQEQLLRSPYPDLILEMALVRMATLAPVIEADELLRAIGAAGSGSKSGGGTGVLTPSVPPAPSITTPAAPVSDSGSRRIPIRGEVKAEAPVRTVASPRSSVSPPSPSRPADTSGAGLPDLRDFIRARRAALAGFMEQGADLRMSGDIVTVVPRNDIYVRYLSDNRGVIADLASELYGRRIKVEMGDADAGAPAASDSPEATVSAAPAIATDQSNGNGTATAVEAPVVRNSAEARQALYSDPVVRRIFNEFEARLVEVRADPQAQSRSAEDGAEPKK
jgi:DNA polymerase-3 subunit gamma/tau